jgi:hypothetical protein
MRIVDVRGVQRRVPVMLSVSGKTWQRWLGHRGHEKDVEIRPPEHYAGHLLNRHVYHPVHSPAWIVANKPAIVDERIPEEPSASTVDPSAAPRERSTLSALPSLSRFRISDEGNFTAPEIEKVKASRQ